MTVILGDNKPTLRSFVDRIERIDEEREALGADRKEIFAEVKGAGFDVKTVRKVLARRKLDAGERQEADALVSIYEHALGMAPEPAIFEQVGAMAASDMGFDRLIELWSKSVPANSDVIVRIGGKSVRIWRDGEGEARHEDYVPPASGEVPFGGETSNVVPLKNKTAKVVPIGGTP